MTPIADMIEAMLEQGAPLAAILVAVRSFEMSLATVGRHADDKAASRRERDRAWRRNFRAKQRLTNGEAKANDVASSVVMSSTTPNDSDDKRCDLSSSTELVLEERGSREVRSTASVVEGRKAKVSRGTRLDRNSQIAPEDHQFALDHGLTAQRIAQAWAEFIDYWIGIPGQRGTKLDWSATWRNRVRAISGKSGAQNGFGGPRPLQDDEKSISRAALRLAEKAERGEFTFGPRPSLLPEDDARPVQLLSKG
jgi:hypothetical protein